MAYNGANDGELSSIIFHKEFKMQKKPLRSRRAKSDGSIGTLINSILEVFDLPEGAVLVVNPDGRRARADGTVRSLRNRWKD